MAGGKLTARQKMINLMYLVFIAMMALNMSKEVLSAFALVNEKFESANASSKENNTNMLESLGMKAQDDPTRFKEPYNRAKQVQTITANFVAEVEKIKKAITDPLADKRLEDGSLPAERMEKGDVIDNLWFSGDKYSKEGEAFIGVIEGYKAAIAKAVGTDVKFQPVLTDLNKRFDISKVKNSQGQTIPYLNYHFQGFPAIASLTKLSTMQNDAYVLEDDIYNVLLGNTLTQAASMKNYKAFVTTDKTVYFAGETFKGTVVLGRYDKSTVPTKVVVNGQNINLGSALKDGQVAVSFGTGNVGEHKISGQFTFMEDGKAVPVEIEGNYVVVPRPNSANISADKMNVVYRGVANPMTISFAGIPSDKVSASAPGLSSAGKAGQYILRPGAGREVVINVTGKLDNGQTVSDRKTFRIKDIPPPRGTVRGEYAARGNKDNAAVVSIGAKLEDFDFEVGLTVTGFVVQIPGQPSIVVQGNRMNDRARAAIAKTRTGDVIVISDIKTRLDGAGDYQLKKTAPCTYEIQ
ncbi:MAG: gliding motility protein GldM [Flavobacteriaceae bacterium]|jgi:gliding motility-associated protein GldM|nr:gliding motility protein GldM [Flavobacteriaceae bacterium]